MSQSDTHKHPIQKSHIELCFMKLARPLADTNRWNLQGSRGEVWRTLPERVGNETWERVVVPPQGVLIYTILYPSDTCPQLEQSSETE